MKSLKLAVSKSARKFATNNNGEKASPADGWEGFDDEIEIDENGDGDVDNENESPTFDFSQIEACAQLSVDLKKAQSACEQLSEQLTKAELQRDQVRYYFSFSSRLISNVLHPLHSNVGLKISLIYS